MTSCLQELTKLDGQVANLKLEAAFPSDDIIKASDTGSTLIIIHFSENPAF